jgi:hypothetical protein
LSVIVSARVAFHYSFTSVVFECTITQAFLEVFEQLH